jgi:hypothetical protein
MERFDLASSKKPRKLAASESNLNSSPNRRVTVPALNLSRSSSSSSGAVADGTRIESLSAARMSARDAPTASLAPSTIDTSSLAAAKDAVAKLNAQRTKFGEQFALITSQIAALELQRASGTPLSADAEKHLALLVDAKRTLDEKIEV